MIETKKRKAIILSGKDNVCHRADQLGSRCVAFTLEMGTSDDYQTGLIKQEGKG